MHKPSDLTELVYGGDIRTLNNAVAEYVSSEKEEVWLLIDDLDKSMATRGATAEDLLILRGLLDVTAKLEKELAKWTVDLHCLVFIRTDVLDQLNQATADRGKDTTINIDWDDPELFREIIGNVWWRAWIWTVRFRMYGGPLQSQWWGPRTPSTTSSTGH